MVGGPPGGYLIQYFKILMCLHAVLASLIDIFLQGLSRPNAKTCTVIHSYLSIVANGCAL